jgi:hypothetical protein
MPDRRDERFSIDLDPEDALRAAMRADPEAKTVEPQKCPKTWQGKPASSWRGT